MPQSSADSSRRALTANHPDHSTSAAWLSVAAATLPAAVAGGLVGLLLAYLNPGSAPGAVALIQSASTYSALGAAAGVLTVLPFLWRNLRRSAKVFPWLMTAVLSAGAVYFVLHAARWSFYLPAVANRRLLYAAAVLFALGIPAFYTALLHTVHQRSYSYRSVGLVTTSGIVAMLVVASMHPPAPRETNRPVAQPPVVVDPAPLMVIGLDGATLEVLLPLAEQGLLPSLGDWVAEGVVAPVATLKPPRPTALWCSVATGMWPFHHRVAGPTVYRLPWAHERRVRLLPEWLGFRSWGRFGDPGRPVEDADLARKPIWEVYRDLGLTAEASGWPPGEQPTSAVDLASQPATADLTLVRVDDLVAASEANLGAWVRARRGERGERIQHGARLLEDAYRAVDRRLASWQASLPDDVVVAVVSVHGYAPLPRWRKILGTFRGDPPGGATARGGQDGVLVLHGPGIRSGERLPPVRLIDVMPTLAHAAGLPVAADLDGEVVTRAFAPEGLADRPLTFVPSYEAWRPRGAMAVTNPSPSAEGRTGE